MSEVQSKKWGIQSARSRYMMVYGPTALCQTIMVYLEAVSIFERCPLHRTLTKCLKLILNPLYDYIPLLYFN